LKDAPVCKKYGQFATLEAKRINISRPGSVTLPVTSQTYPDGFLNTNTKQ
jgi:hypothetical protein